MSFDQWTIWKRVFTVNALGAVGVTFGFVSSEAKLSPTYCVPIAVFTLAFLNLMLLIVRPRILAARAEGKPNQALTVMVDVVRRRMLIVLLVVLQLVGVSRAATAAITVLQVGGGDVRSLADPSNLSFWMVVYSAVMIVIAGVWLASAVGLGCSRSWAWWLALVLNGLAASITVVLQVLDWHSYPTDIGALTAVILLLVPAVRSGIGGTRLQVQRA